MLSESYSGCGLVLVYCHVFLSFFVPCCCCWSDCSGAALQYPLSCFYRVPTTDCTDWDHCVISELNLYHPVYVRNLWCEMSVCVFDVVITRNCWTLLQMLHSTSCSLWRGCDVKTTLSRSFLSTWLVKTCLVCQTQQCSRSLNRSVTHIT